MTVLAAWGWLRSPPIPEPGVTTRAAVTGVDIGFLGGGWRLAISPDGRSILQRSDVLFSPLLIRAASDPEWRPLPNTEGANNPTFSPNGQSVAFGFAVDPGISKVSVSGGPALPIVSSGSNPHWGLDDTIVYGVGGALYRVASSGGDPQVLLDSDSVGVSRAHLLPNGRAVVFGTGGAETSRILIFEIETGEVRELIPSGNQPRYVSTGHLIYGHGDGALMGVPFDVESLQVTGAPVTLLPSLGVTAGGASHFAVSQTGTLVYLIGDGGTGQPVTPVWVERDGTAREIDPGWTVEGDPNRTSLSLSPDGGRLAVSDLDSEGTWDLWVKQLDTGPLSRLTFEGDVNFRAQWSLDGQSVTFVSERGGAGGDIWTKRADGSGTVELVLDTEGSIREASYTPDGTWLVFREGSTAAANMYAIRPGVDSVAVPVEVTEFQERSVSLSRDGRWLAYVSNNTGRVEVYVRPFPDWGSGLVQVSNDGGDDPVWAHNGRELFYRNGANELVAVQVSGDPTFVAGQQEVLFSMADYLPSNGNPLYDVRPDDQSFVMLRMGNEGASRGEAYLVTNWFEELRQRMGN
jgi:serine/threonine-protein kinase